MPLGLFRKRTKTTLADGTKKVIVTDRKGTVRKQKLVKPGGIKEKQKYNKAGNIHTAKLKGPNIKKKKIDNFEDTKGYFKYKGKKYNTESREEKAIRTTKKTTTPKTTEKKNTSTSSVVDDITKGKKNNNKSNEKTGNMNFFGKGGPVKGTGQWAGKNVPGMRKGR